MGRTVVAELAGQGARVGFTFHQGRALAEALTARLSGTRAQSLDLRDPAATVAALDGLCDWLGGLDALVCCATKTSTCDPPRFDTLEEVTLDGWDDLMAVNVRAPFVAVRHLVGRFDRGGNVVLFGSVDGVKPVPSPVPYGASKAALVGMTLGLAKALGGRGIRVNLVAPGVLEAGASRTLPDGLREDYLKHSGLRRLGKVAEVSSLAVWLALENTYVTAQTFVVDGGLYTESR